MYSQTLVMPIQSLIIGTLKCGPARVSIGINALMPCDRQAIEYLALVQLGVCRSDGAVLNALDPQRELKN